jgi:hypothetical protein
MPSCLRKGTHEAQSGFYDPRWISGKPSLEIVATITEWIAPIAACGFVGAFIDFYIGKSGQKSVKKKLEDSRRVRGE